MTDDVAALVLEDNRLQTLAISLAERAGVASLPAYVRLIEIFESTGKLDRAVEGLATNDELLRRAAEQRGLTRPEFAVLLSTAKLALQEAIEATDIHTDPDIVPELLAAFPAEMQRRQREAIVNHQLRREIVATKVANRMVNRLGMIHPIELAEEEGASLGDVAEAFLVVERLHDAPAIWQAIDEADIGEDARLMLFEQTAVELRAHMADMLRNAIADRSVGEAVAAIRPGFERLTREVDNLLPHEARVQTRAFATRLIDRGAPKRIAERIVRLAELDGVIGLATLGSRAAVDEIALTRAFVSLGVALGIDWAQGAAMRLLPSDPWERLLSAGLARDFQAMRLDFLARHNGGDPEVAVEGWLARQAAHVAQFRAISDRARATPVPSTAMLAQIAGQARSLLART